VNSEGVARKIAGIMAAIEDGMYTPALKERMKTLEKRKAELEGPACRCPTRAACHPDPLQHGRDLPPEGWPNSRSPLNDDSVKAEAGDILRSLIDRVVLTPHAQCARRNRCPAPWRSGRHSGPER